MTRQETTEHPEDIQEQEQFPKESKSVTGGNKKELLQHCAQFKKARVSVHSKNSPEYNIRICMSSTFDLLQTCVTAITC